MKEKVYLSIDIDYWSKHSQSRKEAIEYIDEVIKLCPQNIKCVIYHHRLLPHINKSKSDTVYNIDFHSDLSDRVPNYCMNEGTWANFVKFKSTGKFIWFYPFKECYDFLGRCDSEENPFDSPTDVAGWRHAEHKLYKPSLDWLKTKDITGIGFCISPDYIDKDLAMPIVNFLHEKGCITKGKVSKIKGTYTRIGMVQ